MAARDNFHSRVVAWLKIVLPISALVLLSMVFLVARHGDGGSGLPLSRQSLEQMASRQTVDNPEFSTVTDDGRLVTATARSATPRNGDTDVIDADGISARVETRGGATVDVESDSGTAFSLESRLVLRGNVTVTTSDGYTLQTQELIAAMDGSEAEAPGQVHIEGPLGTVDAGRMQVIDTSEESDAFIVVFKDDVRVIYTPQDE